MSDKYATLDWMKLGAELQSDLALRYFTKEYQAEVERKLKERLADPKTEDAVLRASPLLRMLPKGRQP